MGIEVVGEDEGNLLARIHRLVVFEERAAPFKLATLRE